MVFLFLLVIKRYLVFLKLCNLFHFKTTLFTWLSRIVLMVRTSPFDDPNLYKEGKMSL